MEELKMKEKIFGRNPNASYFFLKETLMVQKVTYILAFLCEEEWFSHLFSVLRKIRYKLGKNGQISEKSDTSWEKMEKIQKKNYLFVQKIQSEKTFDVTFGLNRTLQKPRKTNEIMIPIFGLGHEI